MQAIGLGSIPHVVVASDGTILGHQALEWLNIGSHSDPEEQEQSALWLAVLRCGLPLTSFPGPPSMPHTNALHGRRPFRPCLVMLCDFQFALLVQVLA